MFQHQYKPYVIRHLVFFHFSIYFGTLFKASISASQLSETFVSCALQLFRLRVWDKSSTVSCLACTANLFACMPKIERVFSAEIIRDCSRFSVVSHQLVYSHLTSGFIVLHVTAAAAKLLSMVYRGSKHHWLTQKQLFRRH